MKRIIVIMGLIGLIPSVVVAGPIHSHCKVTTWVETTSSSPFALPAIYGDGNSVLNSFSLRAVLPGPESSGLPGCNYEISDIRSARIDLTFLGTNMQWGTLQLGAAVGAVGRVVFDDNAVLNWGSNDGTQSISRGFNLQLHQGINPVRPGPLEFGLASVGDLFPISLFGDLLDPPRFTLIAASVTLRGNHYFIPEPSAIPLLLTAISILLITNSHTKRNTLRPPPHSACRIREPFSACR